MRTAGIVKGDLVLITTRTTPPYLLCWLATTSLGAVAVTVNPASAPAELRGLLHQVRPRVVVSDADLAPILAAADPAAEFPRLDVDGLVGDWRHPPAGTSSPPADVTPDDLAVLIPTSGTTGRSKLVMQTHRAYAWAGEGFPYWMELTRDDVLMTTLPLFHVNAPAYSVMGSLACGA